MAKTIPFEVLYGYLPPTIKDYGVINFKMPVVKNYLDTFDEILHILKNCLETTRNQIKQVDMERTDREFEVGDWVFVQLQPYRQNSLKIYKKHKLGPKLYGPYQIRR